MSLNTGIKITERIELLKALLSSLSPLSATQTTEE